MKVNPQAPVFQEAKIQIQVSPEKVWFVLTQINNWSNWNSKITRSEISEKPAAGVKFRWTVNGAKIKSVLHTVETNKTFGWSGVTFGGSAIHNWYLESKNGGTQVSVEESMEGWLVALFKSKMNHDLKKDMVFWLERLKYECEK
ncbi:MAG: SRPBCC family protein [Bacteroidia bacterium]|nr:SRPBCC family protein [Bacteroidia bacterium]